MTDKPEVLYATYLPSNHEIIKNSTKYEYQLPNHILIFFYSQYYARKCFFMAKLKELMFSFEEF